MEKTDLMLANRARNNEQIKVCEAHLMHVLLTKTNFHPADPRQQSVRTHTAVMTPEEFKRNESLSSGSHPMDWVRISGFDSGYLIHDGTKIDEGLRAEILAYWALALQPKYDTAPVSIEAMAAEIKNLKRKLRR